MDLSKIVRLVAVLVAIIAGVVTIPQSALIIAVLGLIGGYFVEQDRVVYFLAATLVLNAATAAWGPIPGIGDYLTNIFGSVSSLFNAAALTVISVATYKALKP